MYVHVGMRSCMHGVERTGQAALHACTVTVDVRVRFHIIRNARIENVGKSQSCMLLNGRLMVIGGVVGRSFDGGGVCGAGHHHRDHDLQWRDRGARGTVCFHIIRNLETMHD